MLRSGRSKSSDQDGGAESCEAPVCSRLLCLGFREPAWNPERLSSRHTVMVDFLARFRLQRSRRTRQSSITPAMVLYTTRAQLEVMMWCTRGNEQKEKASSVSSEMASWARAAGLEQRGSPETTALFFSSQLLRYWMLQSQWKGFGDRTTLFRLSNLSKRPGGTEVSRLFCTWSSVVSEGRSGSSVRLEELQLTCSPAGLTLEEMQDFTVLWALDEVRRKTAKVKPEGSILEEEKQVTWDDPELGKGFTSCSGTKVFIPLECCHISWRYNHMPGPGSATCSSLVPRSVVPWSLTKTNTNFQTFIIIIKPTTEKASLRNFSTTV